jgi:hypothetical protein
MTVTYSLSPSYIQGPLVAATVFGALATAATAVRPYAMHLKALKPGLSEFFILVGAVSSLSIKVSMEFWSTFILTISIAVDVWRSRFTFYQCAIPPSLSK